MYSYSEQVADGSTNVFAVPFPYIRRANVQAFVDGVQTAFAWLSDGTVALAGSAADLVGKTVEIKRSTPSQAPLVTWKVGGLDPDDLTLSDKQLLYLIQEAFDASQRALNLTPDRVGFDFKGYRGINAGDPQNDQDVTTKSYVEKRVLDLIALVSAGDYGDDLDGFFREAIRALPSVEPPVANLPWLNGGILQMSGGDVIDTSAPSLLTTYLRRLPTSEPADGGQPWVNGGVIELSPGGPVQGLPVPVAVFTSYMLTRPFMPVDSAAVPAGGAWYRWGTAASWVPNFVMPS